MTVSPQISAFKAAAFGPVVEFLLFDPADRLDQPRLPQGAQHRVDRLAASMPGRAAASSRVAIVLGQPMLEHTAWTAGAFPGRAMVGVDRVETAQAEHRLGIESEWIGLQRSTAVTEIRRGRRAFGGEERPAGRF